MAEVQLKNIKKIYPHAPGESKKKAKKAVEEEKKINLHLLKMKMMVIIQMKKQK